MRVENRAALIAVCEGAVDVKAAVHAAGIHRLALSVRGGGHDWAGRVIRHQGLVIDLSRMRQVEANAQTRTATIMAGATAGDLISAAAAHGLVAVTGTVGSVGVAGLMLAGGYGPLSPRLGLALDNMLGAEVVLADGRSIIVDAIGHRDLFWALRGGGQLRRRDIHVGAPASDRDVGGRPARLSVVRGVDGASWLCRCDGLGAR